jgi:hypothetical protein
MGNTLEFMLVPDAVLLNISANDAREVVTLLGGLLQDAGFVKSTFVEAALEREKTMPTGLPLDCSRGRRLGSPGFFACFEPTESSGRDATASCLGVTNSSCRRGFDKRYGYEFHSEIIGK